MLKKSAKVGLLISMFFYLLSGGNLFDPKAQAGKVLNDALVSQPFAHNVWQDVLDQSVGSRGEVDWARLRAHPKRLNQYLEQLAAVSPESHPDYFPRTEDKLAYWLNAHNALAMRMILDRYPIRSLDEVPDFEGSAHYRLGRVPMSLRQLQDRLAVFARIPVSPFYGLTDYTLKSPPLDRQAFQGHQLATHLLQRKRALLRDPGLARMEQGAGCPELLMSPFFQRYEAVLRDTSVALREDRDTFGEEGAFEPQPESAEDAWLRQVRDAWGEQADPLRKSCHHAVRYMSPDSTLRQANPF